MSDLEDDSDILEEIKALENALAQEKTPENPRKKQKLSDLIDDLEPEKLIEKAFEINESLIIKYREAKETVKTRLEECIKKQNELDIKIKQLARGKSGHKSLRYSRAGYPYFKDEKYFSPPLNEDALMKIKRCELMIVYKNSPSRWTVKDRNSLWMAVRLQAATDYFEKETNKQKNNDEHNDKNKEIDIDKCKLPKNYKEMIGPLGSREFDWMKIAAQTFNNRHSSDECKVMWNVYLHPDINRYKFDNYEDKKLKKYVEINKYENWDKIALNIETDRSGYQCFIRYTTLIGPINLKNKDIPWSIDENNILISVVNSLRIGNYIPWSIVAFYIDNRTKNQVYSHWKYNIDPTVKKGRFTPDEDELLLEGYTKYGKDFSRISNEMIPHRTSVQLSGRFTLLMLKTDKSYNSWTVTEDMQLLKLFDEFGPQWSKIAGIMKKNRTYLRHRYASIGKHLAKGRNLSEVPRKKFTKNDKREIEKFYDQAFVIDNIIKEENDLDIDTKLRKYFERVHVPTQRPGRQPKYENTKELEKDTKKLYNLFKKLNVKLEIPENLNIDGLTTKDKQLLSSFRDYSSGKGKNNTKDIEKLRIKMFGNDKETLYFVPPPPFGLYFKKNHKKRGKKDDNEKIIDDNCIIYPDFKFLTPDNIVKMLSDEENEIFEKLSIFICKESSNLSFEEKFGKFLSQNHNQRIDDIGDIDNVTISWGRKIGTDVNCDDERDQKTFIEPCCSTLMGYDMLRYMKETSNDLEWTRDEKKLSKKCVSSSGKHAFHLFKNRFTKLFKYPIGMCGNVEAKNLKSNLVVVPRETCNQSDDIQYIDDSMDSD